MASILFPGPLALSLSEGHPQLLVESTGWKFSFLLFWLTSKDLAKQQCGRAAKKVQTTASMPTGC